MTYTVEVQIIQVLLGVLSIAITAAIGYIAPKVNTFVVNHLIAKQAMIANHVIDGLSAIVEAVVQDFNQRVVSDAKKNGVFTPQLAVSVKQEAVKAVIDKGANLVELGKSALGDLDGLVSSLVEQAVVNNHVRKAL